MGKDSYFDYILNKKIGFGKYQYFALLAMLFLEFIDGIELTLSILYPQIFEYEWGITTEQIEIVGGIFFFGQFIGFLVCGYTSDVFGRFNTLLAGNILSLFAFCGMAFIQNYPQFVFLRFSYGLVFGITMPSAHLLITEMLPQQIRGKILLYLQFSFTLGKIYCIGCCYIFMDNLKQGNWRGLTLSALVPCSIMFILILLFVDESPRFLLIHDQHQQCFDILNKMKLRNGNNCHFYPVDQHYTDEENEYKQQQQQQNNQNQNSQQQQQQQEENNIQQEEEQQNNEQDNLINNNNNEQEEEEDNSKLTDYEESRLIQWKDDFIQQREFLNYKDKVGNLFQGLSLQVTIRLIILGIVINVVRNGIMFIVPFLYEKEGSGFLELLELFIAEIPSVILLFFIIENKKIGRVNLFNIFQGMQMIVFLFLYKYESEFLNMGMMLFKFFQILQTSIHIIILTESYSTLLRSAALGCIGSLSRLSSSFAPTIYYQIYLADSYLIFFISGILVLLTLIIMLTYPIDMTQKSLDNSTFKREAEIPFYSENEETQQQHNLSRRQSVNSQNLENSKQK